jgi:hypothetical protein
LALMPTVLEIQGFAFRFYANDHRPAHVHVLRGNVLVAVIIIGEPGSLPALREVTKQAKKPDIKKALKLVFDHQDRLLQEWKIFFQEGE